MKTRRINLEHLSVSDLEGKALYLLEPGSGRPPELLKPMHMHIFGNGNLLVCLEETNQNSLVFTPDGESLYSSLELHEGVQEGWVVLEFQEDPQQAIRGQTLKLFALGPHLTVYPEEQARRVHASLPHSILINLAEAGRKE